jgi:methyl coenzyme M reductase beta subunit
MIKTSIEKLAREIGFDIAMSDDGVQSDLLNGFCEGLANSMQEREIEMQVCCIVDKLSPKTRNVLKRFYGFIELKEKK